MFKPRYEKRYHLQARKELAYLIRQLGARRLTLDQFNHAIGKLKAEGIDEDELFYLEYICELSKDRHHELVEGKLSLKGYRQRIARLVMALHIGHDFYENEEADPVFGSCCLLITIALTFAGAGLIGLIATGSLSVWPLFIPFLIFLALALFILRFCPKDKRAEFEPFEQRENFEYALRHPYLLSGKSWEEHARLLVRFHA